MFTGLEVQIFRPQQRHMKLMKIPSLKFPYKSATPGGGFLKIFLNDNKQWITQLSTFLKMDRVIWTDTLSYISWCLWLKCWNVVKALGLSTRRADEIFHLCLGSVIQPPGHTAAWLCTLSLFSDDSFFFFFFPKWLDLIPGMTPFTSGNVLWLLVWCRLAASSQPVCSPRQR